MVFRRWFAQGGSHKAKGEEGLLAVVSPGDCDIEVFDLGDMVTAHGRQAFVYILFSSSAILVGKGLCLECDSEPPQVRVCFSEEE